VIIPPPYGGSYTFRGEVHGTVMAGYSASIDNRRVSLTRDGRYQYYDADGNGYGDSIKSYWYYFPTASPVVNTIQFTGGLSGGWNPGTFFSPNPSWEWTASGDVYQNPNFSPSINYFSVVANSTSAGFVEDTIYGMQWVNGSAATNALVTFKASDNVDGAVEEAKYSLSLHDIYEGIETAGPVGFTKNYAFSPYVDVSGPIPKEQLPIQREINQPLVRYPGISLEIGEIAAMQLLKHAGITVSRDPITLTSVLPYNEILNSNQYVRLYVRENMNRYTIKYLNFDELGQVRAIEDNPGAKFEGVFNVGPISASFFWAGPFPISGGF
jgi:hypothetical protein